MSAEVFFLDPFSTFVRVSSFCPTPECLPDLFVKVGQDLFAAANAVVVSKPPNDGIEVVDDRLRTDLFMIFQPGSDLLQLVENLLFFRHPQGFPFELPESHSQKVHTIIDMSGLIAVFSELSSNPLSANHCWITGTIFSISSFVVAVTSMSSAYRI